MTPSSEERLAWSAESEGWREAIHWRASDWLATPALADVVLAFGGSLGVDVASLATWASAVLDNRRGLERQEAVASTITEQQRNVLLGAAEPLGLMRTPRPCAASYDVTVVLGGTTVANRLRTRLAASYAGHGLGTIVGLASHRVLNRREFEQRPPVRAGVSLEWEDLAEELELSFGPFHLVRENRGGQPPTHAAWVDIEANGSTTAVRLMAAPSPYPGRRADTREALGFLLDRLPVSDGSRLLLVTSAIYAPYTFFVAAPLLLGRIGAVEVVGTPTVMSDASRLAQRFAQEINATIATIARLDSPSGHAPEPASPTG